MSLFSSKPKAPRQVVEIVEHLSVLADELRSAEEANNNEAGRLHAQALAMIDRAQACEAEAERAARVAIKVRDLIA